MVNEYKNTKFLRNITFTGKAQTILLGKKCYVKEMIIISISSQPVSSLFRTDFCWGQMGTCDHYTTINMLQHTIPDLRVILRLLQEVGQTGIPCLVTKL